MIGSMARSAATVPTQSTDLICPRSSSKIPAHNSGFGSQSGIAGNPMISSQNPRSGHRSPIGKTSEPR
jgi:hypothetical protein